MADLPVVCTLGPATLKARRDNLLGNLVRRCEERLDLPDGYRFRFTPAADLLAGIAGVLELERQCCRFLRFRLTAEPDEGPVWLEITGPPGTRDFLAGMLEL
jgi:hypothetical protein